MPFEPDDFYVGMISYFTINDLRRDKRIRHTSTSRDNKARPFICYAQADGEAYWTYFTGTMNRCKRTVDRKWLRFPTGRFLNGEDIIIGDGRSTFAGPIDAFAERSHKHDQFKGIYRPLLVPEGVELVCKIVQVVGGLMPETAALSAAA